MAPAGEAASAGGAVDVLQMLRTGTASQHADVERRLGLMDAGLRRSRLIWVLDRLHGFWGAAESGLDAWAARHPADARTVDWPRRRRAALFAEDLRALDADEASDRPQLPPVRDTDEALGRMYVLEGSTLGGVFIDRHLAGLPQLADARLRAFSAYGGETGAMWQALRRAIRARIAAGGDAAAVVTAAQSTFGVLAEWCRTPVRGAGRR